MSQLVAQISSTLPSSGLVGTANLGQVDTRTLNSLSYIVDPINATPGTSTFTYPGTGNVVTTTANGLVTGQILTLTTAGTLPTGVSTGTSYYAIALSGTTVEFASSLANAQGGTAIALSGSATTTGTINPTALSATVQQQVQNGTSSLVNLGSSYTVTSGTAILIENDVCAFSSSRLQVAVAAGQLNLNISTCAKISQ